MPPLQALTRTLRGAIAHLVVLVALPPLSPAEQLSLAAAFAPTFVFHQDESFFPCSPLLLPPFAEDLDATRETADQLGAINDRMAAYERLPRADRLRLSVVYYRVQVPPPHVDADLVIEYWLYYLKNVYRLTGGLVPYNVGAYHPHDLERVFLLLRRDGSAGSYRVRAILGSAHDDRVPINRYESPPAAPVTLPIQMLVERGSHAMAPDIDGNGRYSPQQDATHTGTFVWGIRDRGTTWARYRADYMDARGPSAVRLCGPGRDGAGCLAYRLLPADDLNDRVAALDLSSEARARLFGHSNRLLQLFGGIDATRLLSPATHDESSDPRRMIERSTLRESGFTFGFSNIFSPMTPLVGVRRAFGNGRNWLPNVLLSGSLLLTSDGRDLYEGEAMVYYRVDAMSKLMVGRGVMAESPDFGNNRRVNWLAGAEFEVGGWRVRVVQRDPHRDFWLDVRLLYVF